MRHRTDYVDQVRHVSECHACIGWIAHPDSFASRASGSSGDGLELAFSGECFDGSGSPRDSRFVQDAYRRNGLTFVAALNGLFSGVLLDTEARRTILFLDRYASERLYYHWVDDVLYFASEAKALLAVLPHLRAFDEDGVADFLAFGSCRGTRTLFKGISRLPGASLWVFDSTGSAKQGTYFDPSQWESLEPLTVAEFESAFVDTARAVIPQYAKAESKVGFSITGGLDTRMILACLSDNDAELECYTYGAKSGDTLDVSIGREVSSQLGLEHQVLRVDDRFFSDFQNYLDRSIYISDGCASALSTHELFFSKMAREIAPIRLTGNFGSELLRSMSTLKPQVLAEGLVDSKFAPRVNDALTYEKHEHVLTNTVFDEVSSHLFGPLSVARSQLTFRTPYLDNSLVELAYRAPEVSRRSAAAALRLIASGHKRLGSIPTDLGFSCGRQSPLEVARRLLCKVTFKLDYWDKEGLPPKLAILDSGRPLLQQLGLLGLHKFLPYRRWFREELHDVIDQASKRATSGAQKWWNIDVVGRVSANHQSGRQNCLREIGAILTLESIERVLIDIDSRRSSSAAADSDS